MKPLDIPALLYSWPRKGMCAACKEFGDHYMCSEPDDCACYCNWPGSGFGGSYASTWAGYRAIGYDARPAAGTKARKRWIARQASPVNDGVTHLHLVYNRGEVMWVLRGPSRLCNEQGRCIKVRLKLDTAAASRPARR